MSNIFTYLEEVQHDSIYDKAFNELDLLILTELTYLPFDQLVHEYMSPYCDCRLRGFGRPSTARPLHDG